MNPLLIGGGALALLALFAVGGSASGTSASQDQMIFRDYMWITSLPATSAPLAANLPAPPGCSFSTGHWVKYPSGTMTYWSGDKVNIDGTRTQIAQVFGRVNQGESPVPPGIDIYMWRPNFVWNPSKPSTLQLTKINGYWVTQIPWTTKGTAGTGGLPPIVPGVPYPIGWQAVSWPPPPPGETKISGHWHQPKPGYAVWITPANANTGDTGQYGSSFGFGLSPTVTPPVDPSTAPPGTPPPSPQPIATTPPAAVAPPAAADQSLTAVPPAPASPYGP